MSSEIQEPIKAPEVTQQEIVEEPIKKKRGRKPKVQTEDASKAQVSEETKEEDPKATDIQRKRGRKKKYVIESIKKLRDVDDTFIDAVSFDTTNNELDKFENKTQVSFGSLNITVHRETPLDKHELRKLFEHELKLDESAKVPGILTQDEHQGPDAVMLRAGPELSRGKSVDACSRIFAESSRNKSAGAVRSNKSVDFGLDESDESEFVVQLESPLGRKVPSLHQGTPAINTVPVVKSSSEVLTERAIGPFGLATNSVSTAGSVPVSMNKLAARLGGLDINSGMLETPGRRDPLDNLRRAPESEAQQENMSYKVNGIFEWAQKYAGDDAPKCDLLCNWCCHSFDTPPVPCPVSYDESIEKFNVKGLFCSWECASAYSVEKYQSLALIYMLQKAMLSGSTRIVTAKALPKECLKAFGGPMTIEEYRANSSAGTRVWTHNDPVRQINQYLVVE
jgi:hypothetical protein